MKPLNLDNRPCSPISSNCVIWQGPDIPCIKLCTGDSVSDVIFQLATELCTIIDTLDIKNYDLSCFNLAACPPDDFQALIQFLINQICELQGLTPETDETKSTCPDCVVSVATCLRELDSSLPATMQLIDYVQLLANKICTLISDVIDLADQVTNIDGRVTVLENTPPPTFTLPTISTGCLQSYMSGAATASIDAVLNTLLNNPTIGYCALVAATGLPASILTSVAVQLTCIDDDSPSLANPGQTMGTAYFPTWVNSPTTASHAITNLWLTICDIRAAIQENSITVVEGGEGITVTSSTIGNTTTYTVDNDYLETFVANLTIKSTYAPDSGVIPKVTPSSVNGVQQGQVISKYTSIGVNKDFVTATLGIGNYVTNGCIPTVSFGTFDNDAGLFTITDPGTYLINARIHLKPNNGSSVFWSGATSYSLTPTVQELRDNFNDIGSFVLGIHRPATPPLDDDTFVAQGQSLIPSIDKNVEISVSQVLVAGAGVALRVRVLNTTNRDYDGTGYAGADGISFSIVKLKDGLIPAVCP